jgi:transposase InsO family protein
VFDEYSARQFTDEFKWEAVGLIHHSNRGSQYAAADYRKVLGAAGMIQSMSRKGN